MLSICYTLCEVCLIKREPERSSGGIGTVGRRRAARVVVASATVADDRAMASTAAARRAAPSASRKGRSTVVREWSMEEKGWKGGTHYRQTGRAVTHTYIAHC